MAYVTTQQLGMRLGAALYARLTDRVNGTTGDEAVAQQIIDEAEAEADSYLARRFRTPVDLAAHPELGGVLEARVLDLAEYNAWKSSPFVSDPPQRVHALQQTALRWLKDMAAGRVALPAAGPPASATAEDNAPRYSTQPRTFTSSELDGL